MLTASLKTFYHRDLLKLKQEILLYRNEENIWQIDQDILNSAGNLCLHLVGNLNTYIGAVLGSSGYIRNRPEEFSLKNIPIEDLLGKIDGTIEVVDAVLGSLSDDQLNSEYPQEVGDGRVSTGYFLMHLAMHLSYHLGQVNYHRRLLDK